MSDAGLSVDCKGALVELVTRKLHLVTLDLLRDHRKRFESMRYNSTLVLIRMHTRHTLLQAYDTAAALAVTRL